jgi:D-alanyl-D-alanine carboxypeptidase
MVKIFKVLLLFVLVICAAMPAQAKKHKKAAAEPYNPQYAAIVIEANNGRVWHEENADILTYPASLTKMMLLYMMFEALDQKKIKLTTRMRVSSLAVNQDPSKLGLRAGKTLRVRDAMFGLITKSANDAAVVIAEHLGGSVNQFAENMTKKARALGMHHTIFKNPNGLPNKEQVTTARDMAILSRALYQRFPTYCRYFNTRSFLYNGQVHKNHNHLLGKVPGVDGIKTGFIVASGFNLAASAKRNGMRLIVVVLGGRSSASRDARVAELLEQGFYLAQAEKVKHNGKTVYLASADEEKNHKSDKIVRTTPQLSSPKQQLAPPEAKQEPYKNNNQRKSVLSVAHAADVKTKQATVRDWLIQVGAFKRSKQANLKVKEVMKKNQLKGGKALVAKTNGRRKLFQARVINLTKEQARQACHTLKKQGNMCVAMKNLTAQLRLARQP